MTAKITLMYDTPRDPDAFEADYKEQMELAASTPGLQRVETHRIWPTGQDSPVLAYRLVELFFEDPQAVRDAVGAQEPGGLLPSVFALGAGGVHIVYHEEGIGPT